MLTNAIRTDPLHAARKVRVAMLTLVMVAVLTRLALASAYTVTIQADTGPFLKLASQWLQFDFASNDGWRTPGYPLVLAVLGLDVDRVWWLQSLMGIGVTLLIFLLVFGATRSVAAGLVCGLAHTFTLNQLLLEATVLTETTATLLVVAATYATDRAWRRGWPLGLVVLAGALSSLAVLTRPQYVVLGAVFSLVMVMFGKERRLRSAMSFLAVFTLPLLLWMGYNKATTGTFAMTSLLGFSLTNHTGAFMQDAPEEFAQIRDIYLRYRSKRLAEGGTHAMTIFAAGAELQRATGLTAMQLSNELQKLSAALIVAHPGAYAREVLYAWTLFFSAPIAMRSESVKSAGALRTMNAISVMQRWIICAGYAVFLLMAMPMMWIAWVRLRASNAQLNTAAMLSAVVLSNSVLQALVECCGNGRFAMPTQSLAMSAVAIGLLAARDGLGKLTVPPEVPR